MVGNMTTEPLGLFAYPQKVDGLPQPCVFRRTHLPLHLVVQRTNFAAFAFQNWLWTSAERPITATATRKKVTPMFPLLHLVVHDLDPLSFLKNNQRLFDMRRLVQQSLAE